MDEDRLPRQDLQWDWIQQSGMLEDQGKNWNVKVHNNAVRYDLGRSTTRCRCQLASTCGPLCLQHQM